MHAIIVLLMLTISSKDGSEISRKLEAGPFKSMEDCNTAQAQTGIQWPKDGNITVHQCAAIAVAQERQG